MRNTGEVKQFKCNICNGLCSEVPCRECNKIVCMLHRTKIKDGYICDDCKKVN